MIDLTTGKEMMIAQGISKRSLNLKLFPNFDPCYFPFILAKEDRFITIINLREKRAYALQKCEDKFMNGSRIAIIGVDKETEDKFFESVAVSEEESKYDKKSEKKINLDWL